MIGNTLVEIGLRLKGNRLKRDKAVEDLAIQSGVSEATIHRMEKGDIANIKNLMKVLEVLGYAESVQKAILQAIPDPNSSLIPENRPQAKRASKRVSGSTPSSRKVKKISWPEDNKVST